MNRTAFVNARLFDSTSGSIRAGATVVVEGERIADVLYETMRIDDARLIDVGQRVLMPGLIDAHVHVTATRADFGELALMPPSLIAAQAKDLLEGMLLRGFTTVRDAGGADHGLVEAVERGHFAGPRLYIAGQSLSQTGGHGDIRKAGARWMCTCAGLGLLSSIADGVTEVRRAAREQLRNGARQIKIMAGGGVASPTDPIDGTQYSLEELRAVCEEAEAANTYVMAHAYSPRSIVRAVQAGVRSIEHGNLLDEASAKAMAGHGAFLVATLATYDALSREAGRLGWPQNMIDKLDRVKSQGVEALRIARAAGVPIGYGTDLLGHMHDEQSNEFSLRLPAMSAAEILQSATSVNARLIGEEGRLGVIAPGALADLLVVDGDPTEDVGRLQHQGAHLAAIMKGGRFVKNRL
ncbi:MAG TPA: amidohydrolase family protein [Burkholderiaceae bacterium]|jgi:imidazolonepropionase-like amidohydrolase|nr:amidohydrolase family protein [Burkholderiaceae bacterium]